jgi:hypothetical protein
VGVILYGLQPTVFSRWQREFIENGASAFQAKERPIRQVEKKQKRIEFLEKKVRTKDEVLAICLTSWGHPKRVNERVTSQTTTQSRD